MAKVLKIYQISEYGDAIDETLLKQLQIYCSLNSCTITNVQKEYCYYINCYQRLTVSELEKIKWMLTPHFNIKLSINWPHLLANNKTDCLVEIGPKLSLQTAFSINATSICSLIGLAEKVDRFEMSTRYLFEMPQKLTPTQERSLAELLHDPLTEERYNVPIEIFPKIVAVDESCFNVGVLGNGILELAKFSEERGLDWAEWDLRYYWQLFRNKLKRNPTSIELYDLAQFNSEKLKHWLFQGEITIDGKPKPSLSETLDSVRNADLPTVSLNLHVLSSSDPTRASFLKLRKFQTHQIIFSSNTHNFPTSISPFHGAATGVGSRIRDEQAVGRGAQVIAGITGYAFGYLQIPGYNGDKWQLMDLDYPSDVATPFQVAMQASTGAADYANKFGEPLIGGFCRSFALRADVFDSERIEYVKPIMFSGGIGTVDSVYANKKPAQIGMCVAKIGGLPYRVGMGRASRGSHELVENEKFNFEAIPRGDAEVQQKLYRVVRACIEYEGGNIIESMYSQAAGGNGHVFKQLCHPHGANIFSSNFTLGDSTLTLNELWNAEYQESIAVLVKEKNQALFNEICNREKCNVDYVGHVSGCGTITLLDDDNEKLVDLPLTVINDSKVKKNFNFTKVDPHLKPLSVPADLTVDSALHRVLHLPSVGSKRFLTTKVDRCVGGLVAQQQCIGPCQIPLADYALVALNYFTYQGAVTAIGEQPIKGLLCPGANGRLSVAEALTNLMFCCVTQLVDVKLSLNWAWPANAEEGARLVETCEALCDFVKQLGISVENSNESLSMATKVHAETVKSPGTVIVTAYAPVPDILQRVTPEMAILDCTLVYINLSGSEHLRLGGSALAQSLHQLGLHCPDVDDPTLLKNCFTVVQNLIREDVITAGHDVSDGGLVTCLMEMAFGTNCGLKVNIQSFGSEPFHVLFAEECGVVIEVRLEKLNYALKALFEAGLEAQVIGRAVEVDLIEIAIDGVPQVKNKMTSLRDMWEETSFELEKLQANPTCVKQEQAGLKSRRPLKWSLTYDHAVNINIDSHLTNAPKVAVLREEGSNCDREMSAAFFMVGFEVADVTVTDLIDGKITLDLFQGLVFAGGFSYSDVLGSARGWAATLKFNENIYAQLKRFRTRKNTFAFGCCNGCQVMTLLGWVGAKIDGSQGTMLAPNASGRFECRFVNVKITEKCPAIMFRGMKGSVMGVWAVHGEGQFVFQDAMVKNAILQKNLVSMLYVDDVGRRTMKYPMCPNGSQDGIAGLSSEDGRFLALMPHPDRSAFSWQLPYLPPNMKHLKDTLGSHWLKMFENAYKWALEN